MMKVSVICGMSYPSPMKQKSAKITKKFNLLRDIKDRLWKKRLLRKPFILQKTVKNSLIKRNVRSMRKNFLTG